MSTIADRLKALKITLPETPQPVANYVTAVQSGSLLFLSGHTSTKAGREVTGKLGSGVTLDAGYGAARSIAIDLLATMQAHLGDLDRVARIVKLTGMIASAPDFTDQPKVMNGASDLFVEVFGENGKHARAAIGMVSLPGDASVEIDAIVEIR
ncbi:MAG: RidA family protein [Candidatus Velthaea sp.]